MANPTPRSDLTAEYLRTILSYEPATGVFRWLVCFRRDRPVGSVAGCCTKATQGYVSIGIGRRRYRAHRLAWLYMMGEWPTGWLDHDDTNRSNNRFDNLRPATKVQNGANMKGRASSGYKGVYFDKRNGTYFSSIMVDGVKHYLGRHASPELAHQAYAGAALLYNGEFARTA